MGHSLVVCFNGDLSHRIQYVAVNTVAPLRLYAQKAKTKSFHVKTKCINTNFLQISVNKHFNCREMVESLLSLSWPVYSKDRMNLK